MPKFNRSLSTAILIREIFYISFECFPSYFIMTEQNRILLDINYTISF